MAPLVRPLPVGEAGRPCAYGLTRGLRLVVGDLDDRDRILAVAIAPFGDGAATVSRSTAGRRSAVIAGLAGGIGLDIETIARVELNATAQDRWLTSAERTLVESAADQPMELACHWILKEAYGKARGVGLALPLDLLSFAGRGGTVTLEDAAAPTGWECWSFHLYRDADLMIGVADRPCR